MAFFSVMAALIVAVDATNGVSFSYLSSEEQCAIEQGVETRERGFSLKSHSFAPEFPPNVLPIPDHHHSKEKGRGFLCLTDEDT
jgi:hypothetical protein